LEPTNPGRIHQALTSYQLAQAMKGAGYATGDMVTLDASKAAEAE